MIFTEFRFLFFFALVFAVYWGLPTNRRRKLWLLGASYVFYAAWDWRFLSLIWVSTLVDYVVGLRLAATADRRRRRLWIWLSLAVNLGLLGVFKYFDFFVESAAELLTFLGLPTSVRTLEIVLPVGISFYTFQTLSYSLDVYRGKLEATRSLLDLALFVAFFPQLVAGPILRASFFLPQLSSRKRFENVEVRRWLALFIVGFVKKACIADNLALAVDHYFANPHDFDGLSAWIAVVGFSIQVYCDFSGYSDMAIACGGLLGFEIPINFAFPYFASNVRELWQRWHITLSTWIRDYVFIPLALRFRSRRGGSRTAPLPVALSLVASFLLVGLWHGAAWGFVAWGGFHGLALAVFRLWERWRRVPAVLRRGVALLGLPLTLYWWLVTSIAFRAESLADGVAISRAFVFWQDLGPERLPAGVLGTFALFGAAHWVAYRGWLSRAWAVGPGWLFAAAYGVAAALVLAFMHRGAEPFVYFQF